LAQRFDTATKTKARLALKEMLAGGEAPRLRAGAPGVRSSLRLGRLGWWLVGVCGAMLAVVLVGMAALWIWLSAGPIELDSLKPRIVKALEERTGNQYQFEIGPTVLERGENGPTIAFQGVLIKDRAGRALLTAPKGEVALDLLALAVGEVKPSRLELVGLDLRLTVQPNGALSVAGAQQPDAVAIDLPAPPPANGATADVPNAGPPIPFASQLGPVVWDLIAAVTGQQQTLDRVGLVHGRLEVENSATHRKVVFEDLELAFDKSANAAALEMSGVGPAGRWSVAVKAQGEGLHTLSIDARDLNLDDIFTASGRPAPFEATMPISTKLDIELAADKSLSAMRGRFALGAGYFKLNDPDHEPFLIDEILGGWSWETATGQFIFDNIQLFAGETHYTVGGTMMSPSATEPAWVLDLNSSDAVLAAERPGEEAVHLDQIGLHARFLPGEKKFVVDNFAISGPGVQGSLTGESVLTPDGPTLKLAMKMANTQVLNISRLWPSLLVADVRNWCIQNVRGGELTSGSMRIDWDARTFATALKKQPVPGDSIHGEFAARDVSVQLLPGLPLLSGLDGGGVVTGHDFKMTSRQGLIELEAGRRILASDISFSVPDTSPKLLNPAYASAHLQGSVDALADLLSREALKPFAGLPIDPASITGQFDGQLGLDMKLGKTATPKDAVVHASARLSSLQVDRFLGNEHFDLGDLTVTSDAGNLKIVGDGKLFGVTTNVEILKGAGDAGAAQLDFTLDDAERAKRGFNLGPAVTGPMAFRVKAQLSQREKGADVEVDLIRVNVDNPVPGIVKPAGKPGKATFSVKSDADGATSVSNLSIDLGVGGASIKGGAVQLSSEGAFLSAKLNQVKLSSGDDLKADASLEKGILKLTVRGSVLDSRPVVKALLEQGPTAGPAGDLDLDVKVASALGANKVALAQVDIGLSRRAGEITEARADARAGSATITLRRSDNGVMRLQTADAGALVRFFNLYSHLEGGTLDLVMRQAAGRQDGVAVVTNFVLRNEPALRQLVAAGQAPPPGQTPALGAIGAASNSSPRVDPDAAPFQKMSAQFTRTAGRIELRDAAIYDAAMGLTTQGYIDLAHDHIDLNGIFVPAFGVNNLVTHIPFVGLLLGGGTNEGMFAINYRLEGASKTPALTVNPFSAITPGFLRKIFGAIDGTSPLPQGDLPPGDPVSSFR
jgi:hypothetical protein